MMFYATDPSGNVTGPHTPGEMRRRLEAGEMTWKDQVCAHGTEHWVPAAKFEKELGAPQKSAGGSGGMVCGACGSGKIQKLRVIYETGTSMSVTSGSMVGGVMDGDGGFDPVLGATSSRTSSSTVAAARCAPPRWEDYKPVDNTVALVSVAAITLVIGFLLLLAENSWPGVALLAVAGIALTTAFLKSPSAKTKRQCEAYFHNAMADWDEKWFCHQCGGMGKPVKS